MSYVETLFTPVRTTISPDSGDLPIGATVTIDSNVPTLIYYTLDGSAPEEGEIGTFSGFSPVSISLYTSTKIRYKALDSRAGFEGNESRTLSAEYNILRNRPLEDFKTRHFYLRLNRAIVDAGFYFGPEGWVVPVSERPMTYVFVNRESFPVHVRLLHNGADVVREDFPLLATGESYEFLLTPTSGDNEIVIQTSRLGSGEFMMYDVGQYDVDTYGP